VDDSDVRVLRGSGDQRGPGVFRRSRVLAKTSRFDIADIPDFLPSLCRGLARKKSLEQGPREFRIAIT